MPKNPYTLGTENASKQLLRDLYIDLRAKAISGQPLRNKHRRPAWGISASIW